MVDKAVSGPNFYNGVRVSILCARCKGYVGDTNAENPTENNQNFPQIFKIETNEKNSEKIKLFPPEQDQELNNNTTESSSPDKKTLFETPPVLSKNMINSISPSTENKKKRMIDQ